MRYIVFIVATMVVLPVGCSLIESGSLTDLPLLGKWFLFWGVGVRLMVAGASQAFRPAFTASILNVDESAYVLIRELGFANVIFGVLGVLSLFNVNLRLAATAGGFYMGLAGLYHMIRLHAGITLKERVALASDLWILVVVIVYVAWGRG